MANSPPVATGDRVAHPVYIGYYVCMQFKFNVSKTMDSWFTKQSKRGKLVSDIMGSSSEKKVVAAQKRSVR
jgi:hypothetical protein